LQAAARTLCQVLFSHAGCVLQLLMLLLLQLSKLCLDLLKHLLLNVTQ
jgi:hypothetical protein